MNRRSPIITWLLLAATLCLDAIAVLWLIRFGNHPNVRMATYSSALIYAQLSILCAWTVLFHAKIGPLWLVPFGAGLVAVLIVIACVYGYAPETSSSLMQVVLAGAGIHWLHVAMVLIAIWTLKPTRFLAGYIREPEWIAWQFGTKHLLILMTGLSILLVLLTGSIDLGPVLAQLTLLTIGSVIVAVIVAIVVQAKWHHLLRLASSLGATFAIGVSIKWLTPSSPRIVIGIDYASFYLIQAILIWSWLEVLSMRALNDRDGANDENIVRDTT